MPDQAVEKLSGNESIGEEPAKAETHQPSQPEKTRMEQIEALRDGIGALQKEIDTLTRSNETTATELAQVRSKIGAPPSQPGSPNEEQTRTRIAELHAKQEELRKQERALIGDDEKRLLIETEIETILQEKIDQFFAELGALTTEELESILQTGTKLDGSGVHSAVMGELAPETAQSLAKAFRDGVKLLHQILESLPDLLKQFEQELRQEAEDRIEEELGDTARAEEERPKDFAPEPEPSASTEQQR